MERVLSKYDSWRDYLMRIKGPSVTLTFEQLGKLTPLPLSGIKYAWWWANEDPDSTTHVQCRSWQSAGFVAKPNMLRRSVTFIRSTKSA
jgi:hypothetical protein